MKSFLLKDRRPYDTFPTPTSPEAWSSGTPLSMQGHGTPVSVGSVHSLDGVEFEPDGSFHDRRCDRLCADMLLNSNRKGSTTDRRVGFLPLQVTPVSSEDDLYNTPDVA